MSAIAPKDTSVVGQTLKVIAVKPDAVVIGASGTPAALPARTLVEHGYKGKLYFNHGVANNDFLRIGGKDVEGNFVPASPVIVAAQLPDSHPAKKARDGIHRAYESANGAAGSVTAFGSYTWDACLELANAIPQALTTANPAPCISGGRFAMLWKPTKGLEVVERRRQLSQDGPSRIGCPRPGDGADPRRQMGAARRQVERTAERRITRRSGRRNGNVMAFSIPATARPARPTTAPPARPRRRSDPQHGLQQLTAGRREDEQHRVPGDAVNPPRRSQQRRQPAHLGSDTRRRATPSRSPASRGSYCAAA